MSNLMGMLTTIQSYVWGPPTLLLLIGTGLYFTIKLRGLQITKFPRAVRAIFEKESGTGSGEGDVKIQFYPVTLHSITDQDSN